MLSSSRACRLLVKPSLRPLSVLRHSCQSRCIEHTRSFHNTTRARDASSGPRASRSQFSIHTRDPQRLIQRLTASDANIHAQPSERSSVALLFTPPFANLLGNDSQFLHSVISNSLREVPRGAQVDVLAAVIDAIPISNSSARHDEEIDADSGAGADGLSVCLVDSIQSQTPWDDRSSPASWPENGSLGRLSFLVETPVRDGAEPSIDMSYQVSLPLPNTVFQNGELQTLKALSYRVSSVASDGTPQMEPRGSQQLLSCALRLNPGKVRALAGSPSSTGSLAPLTQFRRVAESMGNILRRLEEAQSKEGQITASHELETSLRQWKERPFEIWAEIVPYTQWQNNTEDIDKLPLISRLEQGHRFARILSGGGGWGARAGLLSLDPETIPYKVSDHGTMRHSGSELPFELPDLVRKGDFIRYLLAPSPFAGNPVEMDATTPSKPSKFPSRPIYEFGSGIRQDTEDDMPPPLSADDAVLSNAFGALSHKAAAVEIHQTVTRKSSATSRQENHLVQTLLPPRATLGFG